jgi:arylsulfatase A-like enzyme
MSGVCRRLLARALVLPLALFALSCASGRGEATIELRRLDGTPASLLDRGEASQGNVWDAESQEMPRPRAQRGAIEPGGAVTLRPRAAFVAQFPGRAHGRMRLSLRGEASGAPAKARLFALLAPVPELARADAVPAELAQRLGAMLVEVAWPAGARAAESALFDGDPGATWFLLVVETDAGELRLDHVELAERFPAAVQRHGVGAETRPSTPVAAGATRRVELPAAPAGATVELAVAPPEGMAPLVAPLRVRCRLEGSREGEVALEFVEPATGLPLRRWRDVVFHLDRAPSGTGGTTALEVAVEGAAGTAALVAEPRLLPTRAAATPPNLLLISIDTLRADRLGRGATPNLDRFARSCVAFTRAVAPANYTTPSHASMMTGLEPAVHGALRFGERRSIRNWPALASRCARAGLATAAFTGGGLVDAAFGFDEGFDRYRTLDPLMTPDNPRYASGPRKSLPDYNRRLRAEASLDEVKSWLAGHADRRFFCFLHTYHAHDYSPSAATAAGFGVDPHAFPKPAELDPKLFPTVAQGTAQLAHYERLYDAAASEADAAFGEILATLESSGLLATTVVLVTADHGEGFQEHGFLFHATGLNDEVLHVPFLLHAPGLEPATIDAPVGLIDVAPTLLELADLAPLAPPADVQGRSLVPLLRGGEASPRALLSQDCPPDGLTHSAIVIGRFKYVRLAGEPGREHLWDLVDDPLEQQDLAADPDHASDLAQARAALDRKLAETRAAAERAATRAPQDAATDADLAAELRRLGYIGY